MDADYQQGEDHESEMIDSTKKKKRRRRNKFSELLAKKKPKFDPKSFANYEQYYDQYYGLDYEDLIGDVPCRFKYRKVVANDYGLTFDEVRFLFFFMKRLIVQLKKKKNDNVCRYWQLMRKS